MIKRSVKYVRDWYGRFERPISSLSLVGGFVFDALTLRRLDTAWENFWIIIHLLIIALFIILINAQESRTGDEADPAKAHFWYVNILQFFFGGLLSAYLVFYFRSSDIASSWPFILLLIGAFWANESLKRHYARLTFQASLFFLSLFSFAIFLLPIVFHSFGPKIFILSGLTSLVLMFGFLILLKHFSGRRWRQGRAVGFSVITIFIVFNILYFTNLIPPIPLSLKDADVYHSIYRNSDGDYVATYEDLGWKRYITLYPSIHVTPGEKIIAYSAIFSPTSLNVRVIHNWQRYDSEAKKWISAGRIELPVIGGREGGFRTYSDKADLEAGRWQVRVETPDGLLIGRIRFTVVEAGIPPETKVKINQ